MYSPTHAHTFTCSATYTHEAETLVRFASHNNQRQASIQRATRGYEIELQCHSIHIHASQRANRLHLRLDEARLFDDHFSSIMLLWMEKISKSHRILSSCRYNVQNQISIPTRMKKFTNSSNFTLERQTVWCSVISQIQIRICTCSHSIVGEK